WALLACFCPFKTFCANTQEHALLADCRWQACAAIAWTNFTVKAQYNTGWSGADGYTVFTLDATEEERIGFTTTIQGRTSTKGSKLELSQNILIGGICCATSATT